jgi:hypothetical protein
VRPEEEDGNGRNEEEGSSNEEEVSLAINRWRFDRGHAQVCTADNSFRFSGILMARGIVNIPNRSP